MTLQDFYRAVLPAEGAYALFLSGPKRHVWAQSIDELVQATEELGDTQGVYFATASFNEPTRRTADNALYRRAFCFDIDAGAAKAAKHGDAVYLTQREALLALMAWVESSGLRPGVIASSGAGLHAYFLLDQDTTIAEWEPVADALKGMALAQGLRIDPSVTGDAARVLRPVGTVHPSGSVVRALASPGITYTLAELAGATKAFRARPQVEKRRGINDDILDAPVGPPKTVAKIGKHCAAMNHVMSRRGDVSEPYWRAMLGIVKFTVEGADAAHAYSEGHPDYDWNATQDKLDRWTAGPTTCSVFEAENPSACGSCPHRGKIKSPVVLGYMNDVEPDLTPPAPAPVEPAPFSSVGDDEPAEKPAKPDVWDAYMPEGFKITAVPGGGYIMSHKRIVEVPDPAVDGEVVKVAMDVGFCNVPFWFDSWAPGTNDNDQANAVYRMHDPTTGRTSNYNLPTRMLAKRDTLLTALAGQNIQAFNPKHPNVAKAAMEDFVKASLERIRSAGQRQKVTERFGTLYDHQGALLVAQGAHLIEASGRIVEAVVSEKLRGRGSAYRVSLPNSLGGVWEPTIWDEHIHPRAKRHVDYLREFYSDKNFTPYQLAIMLAWSSPLLAFMQGTYHPGAALPGIGLTVSLFSPKSGIGKTAAMHAAALAFGVPTAMCLQLDRNNSTDNARQGLLLQSGTMPSFMDEMEDVPAADLASLISAVGNGASKLRMTKETALTGGVTTALINIMSTNKSHRELAAADRNESAAVQMRLLEIDCSGVAEVSRERGLAETEARSRLNDCAGAVGAMLHREMCRVGGAGLNRLGIECADKARGLLEGRQDGRFMWRALGAILLLRRLLNQEHVGLKVFELDTLVAEFKKWHDAGYEFANERIMPSEGVDMLSMLLSDLAANTLLTQTESHRAGGDEKAKVIDIPLNDRVPDNVLARGVLGGRYVYVKTDAVRDWCFKRKVSHQGLISRCRDAGVFEPHDLDKPTRLTRQIDLYKGTKLAQGVRSSVFKVMIDKLGRDPEYGRVMSDNVVPMARPAGEAKKESAA